MGRPNGKWISNQSWCDCDGSGVLVGWTGGYGFIWKCNLFPGVHTEHNDARGDSSHYSLYTGSEGGGHWLVGDQLPWKGLGRCCGAVCAGLSGEGARKHCCHSIQITEFVPAVNTDSSKNGKGFPPKRKSVMTQERHFHVSHGKPCLLRKASLGLLRNFALSVTGSVITTADRDCPHVLCNLPHTLISCRNFLIKETTKLSILAEQLMEKIKNLWYTKVLGY